ncbi:PREDICTED: protein MIZU-KUSSEI 1-like [Tarenaya hassleriana]|uniref:protein MIZU-KUSSEI 1-like n=1 Tax=Tarenaya hassleriana TaxID=28532 RepID=UPI00053C50BA|nr:PREDICTED: protein MIZU-KUSSEI 1-like [Tarenaya hassleriana]
MARGTSQEFSSKRHHSFHWTRKVGSDENDDVSSPPDHHRPKPAPKHTSSSSAVTPKRKLQSVAVSRLRSVIASLSRTRPGSQSGLGSRVVGTLFGSRRGHVHFAIQKDSTSPPAFLVELATPISGLVKEMASGLVRIALECSKPNEVDAGGGAEKTRLPSRRLVEEPLWRTYCNGKKSGFATRRECGEKETKVLKALEMISMGAGVLPEPGDSAGGGGEVGSGAGDVMYMRAKFERIVGSRDSEAFYMMNPDSNGAPELSIYLLRI